MSHSTKQVRPERTINLGVAGVVLGLWVPAAAALEFSQPVIFPLEGWSGAVALADFDRDGKLDAVTSNSFDGTTSILFGNGDGSFRAGPHDAPISSFFSLVVTDLNRDRKPDVITLNSDWDPNLLSVLFGKGRGKFQRSPDEYRVGNDAVATAIADLNGDGRLDAVVTNSSDNTISVLIGKGRGRFLPKVDYSTAPAPQVVALSDLNRDGKQDIILTYIPNGHQSPHRGEVSVLLGNGDGSFQPGVDYPLNDHGSPYSLALGDLDGDGKTDAVAVAFGGIEVLLGNGDGGFQPSVTYTGGNWYATSVRLGDMNGDGKLDAVAGGGSTIFVWLGNGDGSFQPNLAYPTGLSGGGGFSDGLLALGDLNGDGKLDVATVGANFDNGAVSVLLNGGNPEIPALTADLAIKLHGPKAVKPNQRIAYRLNVANQSGSRANGVTVTTDLGTGAAYYRTPRHCVVSGQTLVCGLGALEGGKQQTLRIVGKGRRGVRGILPFTARIAGNVADPNPANDSATVSTRVK